MNHIHLQECLSTQTYLENLIDENFSNYNAKTIISTNHQKSGKGQKKNKWLFFPGSLAFSFLLRPHKEIQLTPLEIAVLIKEYFSKYHSISLKLKWPNDLIFQSGKCGGILCQLKNHYIICGVGINLSSIENRSFKFPPSSLPLQGKNIQQSIPKEIYQYILNNRKEKNEIIQLFHTYCDHIDKTITLIDRNQNAIFKSINSDGSALIITENGQEKIYNGSIFYN